MISSLVTNPQSLAEYLGKNMTQQSHMKYQKTIFQIPPDALFMTLTGEYLKTCTVSLYGKTDDLGVYHVYPGITKIACDKNSEGHGSYVVKEILRALQEVPRDENMLIHRPLAITVLLKAQRFRKKNQFHPNESSFGKELNNIPPKLEKIKDIRVYTGKWEDSSERS